MDETEVIKEEQTESEQELDTTLETEETQVEADNEEETAETEAEEPETEESETGQSDGSSEPVTRTETVIVSDFGEIEELIQETNVLLVEHNELLESVNSNFVVVSTLLGMLLGMLAIVIFGGAMNHGHN